MSGRLMVLLGIVAVGAIVGIAGVAQPAAADLVFGATNPAGDCIALVTPAAPSGACNGGGFDLGTNTATWISPTGVTVTSESFPKNPTVTTAVNQFLEPRPFGTSTEAGIGISPPNGEADNEINNVLPPSALPPFGNYVTLLVTHPDNAFTGTISIDSLQAGELAEVCAEPNASTFGGANCVQTMLNGTVNQVFGLPAAYSAADPWLAIDAVSNLPAISDVKIDDLDVSVPEPGTVALLLTGIAGLVLARRRSISI
jgi:hypothetical protein